MSTKSEKVGKIEVDNFNFIWKIKDFESQCVKVGDNIRSPYFHIRHPVKMSPYYWYLSLYPYGKDDNYKDYLSLFMNTVIEQKDLEVEVNCKLSFLNHISKEETYAESGINTYNMQGKQSAWGYPHFILREELFGYRDTLLVDDTLMIKCTIQFDPYCDEELDSYLSLSDQFQQLYTSEKFSDVTIQVGRRKIKAHKNVLAARSETFSNIFDNVKQENGSHLIKVTDFNYEVMNEVMKFIYCDKVNNIKKLAMPLLKAANHYRLDRLKIMCGRSLWKSLAINNAIETLKVADSCECPELKSKAMKFVIDNIKNIVDSDGFKLLRNENPKLLEEILCEVAKKS